MSIANFFRKKIASGGEGGMPVNDLSPETQAWIDAVSADEKREKRQTRRERVYVGLTVVALAWGGAMSIDNWRMGQTLAYLAQHPTILKAETRPDGHTWLVPAETTVTKDVGDHAEDVRNFVLWSSRVYNAAPALTQDRNAARARLAGGDLVARYDAMIRGLPAADQGFEVHVTDLIVTPTQWAENDGVGVFHARFRVRTYKAQRLESDVIKTMLVNTRSTEQRIGAEDGVEIFGFSDPAIEQDLRTVAMRR
jgi:hypothetical protein